MTITTFSGAAKPLDSWDIPALAYRIEVSEDHLQAFLNVESRSTGFDSDHRPIILTEPHVFYRNLTGAARDRAVRAGLAYPKWGTKPYPKTQDDRYAWLDLAMRIDEEAALKSCSWGSTQILGENYGMVGFDSAEEMVIAFMADEEAHVEAMVNFILASGIADDLRAERWAVVARVYNGPGYKKNGYDTKMAQEFAKLRKVPDTAWQPGDVAFYIPDAPELKRIQQRLWELGYKEVGKDDGIWGTKSRAAVLAFRADNRLPLVPGITDAMTSALMLAPERAVAPERQNATASDLRKAGSETIKAADKAGAVGAVVAAGGAVSAAQGVLDKVQDQIDGLSGLTDALDGIVGSLSGVSPYLLLLLGGYVLYQQVIVKRVRVQDHQSGKNNGSE